MRGERAVFDHRFVHLERPKLGTPYPVVVARICELFAGLATAPKLVVDQTGVGRAVIDMLRQAHPRYSQLLPVTITAAGGASSTADGWHVAKKDLVGVVQVALRTAGSTSAKAPAGAAAVLTRELLSFKAKITASGNLTFATPDWRENDHDDYVLATALAIWTAERGSMTPEFYA